MAVKTKVDFSSFIRMHLNHGLENPKDIILPKSCVGIRSLFGVKTHGSLFYFLNITIDSSSHKWDSIFSIEPWKGTCESIYGSGVTIALQYHEEAWRLRIIGKIPLIG